MKILDNHFRTLLLPLILVSVIFTANNLYAQEYNWSIILNDKTEINNVVPFEIKKNILVIKGDSGLSEVQIENLLSLKKIAKTGAWTHASYGALVGAGVLALITGVNMQEKSNLSGEDPVGFSVKLTAILFSAALCGMVGGLLGGLVGLAASGDEVYDFKDIPINGRLTQLDWIIKNKVVQCAQ